MTNEANGIMARLAAAIEEIVEHAVRRALAAADAGDLDNDEDLDLGAGAPGPKPEPEAAGGAVREIVGYVAEHTCAEEPAGCGGECLPCRAREIQGSLEAISCERCAGRAEAEELAALRAEKAELVGKLKDMHRRAQAAESALPHVDTLRKLVDGSRPVGGGIAKKLLGASWTKIEAENAELRACVEELLAASAAKTDEIRELRSRDAQFVKLSPEVYGALMDCARRLNKLSRPFSNNETLARAVLDRAAAEGGAA